MVKGFVLFLLVGFAEIGGGYLIWLWLREGKPLWIGISGAMILILYGIVPTCQSFPSFARIYAPYGGVFIFLSYFGVGLWSGKLQIVMTF